MAALDLIAASRDASFSARVAMISLKSAVAVANEDPGTADHADRVAWANKALRGEVNNKQLAAAIVASNSSITATINATPANLGSDVPDGDIEFALNSIITALGRAETAA
jgi:hypothetical protein